MSEQLRIILNILKACTQEAREYMSKQSDEYFSSHIRVVQCGLDTPQGRAALIQRDYEESIEETTRS